MYRLSYIKGNGGGHILGEWESTPTPEEIISVAPYLAEHGLSLLMLGKHSNYLNDKRDRVILEEI